MNFHEEKEEILEKIEDVDEGVGILEVQMVFDVFVDEHVVNVFV
mgnify:CR=1 FL=1